MALQEALHKAILENNSRVVQRLLAHVLTHGALNREGVTLLPLTHFFAATQIARSNGQKRMNRLMRRTFLEGAHLTNDAVGRYLASARNFNRPDMALFFLSKTTYRCNPNSDIMLDAVRWDRMDVIHLLVKRGANIDVGRGEPLKEALQRKKYKIVKLFLQKGAAIYPEMLPTLYNENLSIGVFRLFVARGVPFDDADGTHFAGACMRGNLPMVHYLLRNSSPVLSPQSLQDRLKRGLETACRCAIRPEYGTIIKLIVGKVINICDCYETFATVLRSGNVGFFLLLLGNPGLKTPFSDEMSEFLRRVAKMAIEIASPVFMKILLKRGLKLDVGVLKRCNTLKMARTIVANSQYPIRLGEGGETIYQKFPQIANCRRMVVWRMPWYVKQYLYSPWSRWATENLELMHIDDDDGRARAILRHKRNKMIDLLMCNEDLTQDLLLERYASIEWDDDRGGKSMRSLIGEGRERPSRRQMICRLPTRIMEELVTMDEDTDEDTDEDMGEDTDG